MAALNQGGERNAAHTTRNTTSAPAIANSEIYAAVELRGRVFSRECVAATGGNGVEIT